jgi:hypothetical protein
MAAVLTQAASMQYLRRRRLYCHFPNSNPLATKLPRLRRGVS